VLFPGVNITEPIIYFITDKADKSQRYQREERDYPIYDNRWYFNHFYFLSYYDKYNYCLYYNTSRNLKVKGFLLKLQKIFIIW